MKYSVIAADLQEALSRYYDFLNVNFDLLDFASISNIIHFDGDNNSTSAYAAYIDVNKANTIQNPEPQSKAEKHRLELTKRKQAMHSKMATMKMNEIRSLQLDLINNAVIEESHRLLLLDSLEALLHYQSLGQIDGIIGLPRAEVEYLRSLPRKESNHSADQDLDDGLSCLRLPSPLKGFQNMHSFQMKTPEGFPYYVFYGVAPCENPHCPNCDVKMRSKGIESIVLKHVPIGNSPSFVVVDRRRFQCPTCEHTQIQNLEFQDKEHRITTQLREYVEMLLSATFNLKDTAELTGVGINEVKDIDEARLKKLYTVDGVKLKKPETQATFLSIDEFKLHNGHQYATIIINLQNRHILWVERGKKKQVVYNFFEHVGDQWMKNVKAVACDMNSDFQEAFEERYPHIRVVFDHFHIVKNFNEKVISPIRIEEQKRLEAAGETAAARSLKRSKYILTATRKTLSKLDKEAEEGKTAHKGSTLFKEPPIYRKGGKVKRYEALIAENKLLFACDMVKTLLEDAYTTSGVLFVDRLTMGKKVHKIIKVCRETNDKNMEWFANLLETHYKGVIAYATYPISSGIIEGVNQRIKTVRRDGYGYPDDEYFFLKIIDASRNNYIDQRRKIKLKPYIRVKADDIRAQVA